MRVTLWRAECCDNRKKQDEIKGRHRGSWTRVINRTESDKCLCGENRWVCLGEGELKDRVVTMDKIKEVVE